VFKSVDLKILYFGTPVVLIATLNEDGSANIGPMSSAWALGRSVVLGLGKEGKTYENLTERRECVLNIPSDNLAGAVERLAPLTGKFPVPAHKREKFRYEKDKFGAAGLTAIPSQLVQPPRICECPLQFEAVLKNVYPIGDEDDVAAVEVQVIHIHAREDILHDASHIEPVRWRPLIYNFRHYFGLGEQLGKSFRSET
jgi:flavin reductase (DIM6/NTAB) family NADH-FMN oxidoreductase RutF